MAAMNKWLLISEGHGNSNRCTPYRGKPDQHDTYVSHANPRMPGIRFLRADPILGNLSWVADRVGQSHSSQEKLLPTQSTARRLIYLRVRTQFLSRANQWSSGESQTYGNCKLLGLLGPYHRHAIVTGTNPSVLNWHRQGLPHRNLGITTTLSPPFPSKCSTGPPKWPRPVSILSNINLQ
jgi:hypothetical protein